MSESELSFFSRHAYAFELPAHLIAQEPAPERDASRLMVVSRDLEPTAAVAAGVRHATFRDLPDFLDERHLLVINDSAVRPARLFARREHGGRVEVLLLSQTGEMATALLRANRRLREGEWLSVEGVSREGGDDEEGASGRVQVGAKCAGTTGARELHIPGAWLDVAQLERLGLPPLPPYIRREPGDGRLRQLDKLRYQTVYARPPSGDDDHDDAFSAAAPTAGLHFTPALLEECAQACAGVVALTLHVGLGTFLPVKSEDLREHEMHTEPFRVRADALERLRKHREAGGRLVAVGTTSARVLETLARSQWLPPHQPGQQSQTPLPQEMPLPATVVQQPDGSLHGETALFLHPPHTPVGFDGLITNFHLPESTLIMLVATLLGRERTLNLYEEAIKQRYRFFSYGDAMFIR